jgi:hypothetical protein
MPMDVHASCRSFRAIQFSENAMGDTVIADRDLNLLKEAVS